MLLQMWEHTPNCVHSFLSGENNPRGARYRRKSSNKNCAKRSQRGERRTFTSVGPVGLEARFAGAERVRAIHHAVSFISLQAHCPVTATVAQHVVCKHRHGEHAFTPVTMRKMHCQDNTLQRNTPFILHWISSEP